MPTFKKHQPLKIIISGEGGQGIKLLSGVLAKILFSKGYDISLALDYDTVVRGGKIVSFMVIAKAGKVDNPIIEKADYLFKLSKKGGNFYSQKVFVDDKSNECDLLGKIRDGRDSEKTQKLHAFKIISTEIDPTKHTEVIPFSQISFNKFNNPKVMNMLVLGKLLALVEIDPKDLDWEKYLPERFREQNIKAILYGYTL